MSTEKKNHSLFKNDLSQQKGKTKKVIYKYHYKYDIGHWRNDHSYFKSYSGHYKGDFGQMKQWPQFEKVISISMKVILATEAAITATLKSYLSYFLKF